MTASTRHRWGPPDRMVQKTERECLRGCHTIRVTFHRNGRHWIEFYRNGEQLPGPSTPICEPVVETACTQPEKVD